MSSLKQFVENKNTIEEGVHAYISDLTTRYPHIDVSTRINKTLIKCDWVIEYQTKTDNLLTVLLSIIPLLFGHLHLTIHQKNISFATYHFLENNKIVLFRITLFIRKVFLPLFLIILMLFIAFGFVVVIGLTISLSEDGLPNKINHPLRLLLLPLVYIGFLYILNKIRLFIRNMGRPPNTNEFDDDRIKLKSIQVVHNDK
jgi:hypothetical protein